MEYITVKFLGKEYQIPKTVKTFLEYDQLLKPVTNTILQKLNSDLERNTKLNPTKLCEYIDNDIDIFKNIIKSGADLLTNKMVELGIYDITTEEFFDNTNVLNELNNLTEVTKNELLQYDKEAFASRVENYRKAYEQVSDGITGTGVTIFTNSFTTALAYSIVEENTISSQTKKAEKQYREMIQNIERKSNTQREKIHSTIMLEGYYPKLFQILTNFPNELMGYFFTQLTSHDKFDFDSIEDYSMKTANNILSHIDKVNDKINLLIQAFEACPFCLEVYEKCLVYKLLDDDTFQTADCLDMADDLCNEIYNYMRDNLKELSYVLSLTKIISKYKNIDEASILKDLYNETIKKVYSDYDEIKFAINDEKKLDNFIRKHLFKDFMEVTYITKEAIVYRIDTIINQIITNEMYDKLISYNIISPKVIRLPESNSTLLNDINLEIKTKLINKVSLFVEEANKRYNLYIQENDKFDNELKKLNNELVTLENDKIRLKKFSFSKKRNLSYLISQKKEEIEKYQSQNTPRKYLVDFESMYSGYPYSIQYNQYESEEKIIVEKKSNIKSMLGNLLLILLFIWITLSFIFSY